MRLARGRHRSPGPRATPAAMAGSIDDDHLYDANQLPASRVEHAPAPFLLKTSTSGRCPTSRLIQKVARTMIGVHCVQRPAHRRLYQAGERRSRYPVAASLPRSQEHSTHGPVHRTGAEPVQGFLSIARRPASVILTLATARVRSPALTVSVATIASPARTRPVSNSISNPLASSTASGQPRGPAPLSISSRRR
jgi:hypothetical protein